MVLDKFPELKKYRAIQKRREFAHLDMVLRYIIYLYDPDSDLRREIPDFSTRKVNAALLAGFQTETPEYKRMLAMQEPIIVDLVQCFLSEVYHNRDYTEWCTLQQELDEYTKLRLKALDDKTDDGMDEVNLMKASDLKGKLRKQCEEIHESLDALEDKIWGDDDGTKELAVISRFSSPEAWSKALMAE